jgi:hypothetical protein
MIDNVEKILELIHEDHCQKIQELTTTTGFSYGVHQILTENLHMCSMALHHKAPAQTSLKTTEIVTNNMVINPHPPYLLGLAPSDFAFFLKSKMKLKGQCSETVSDIKRESQVVLD